MDSSIVTTKIYIPQIREDLLLRLDLITRVKKGLSLPLTLISAPAGYGKTTLLVELASSMPLAWYSIDDEDNDPIRFWSYAL
jgi:LuxR family maltose regulon positive regulatory protein